MNNRQRTFSFLCMFSMIFASYDAVAQQVSADALMKKVCDRSAFRDMSGELTLRIVNKRGDQKLRKIKIWSKENEQGENKMLMRFISPADVRGVGFLMIEHKNGEDDRRLFLPALRRVQRISASGKGGNFMSSDFTYYDIGAPKLDDWHFSLGGQTQVDGIQCQEVLGSAANPQVTEDTGYSKIRWYIDPARQIAMKADYFDKDGQVFKTMTVEKIEVISGSPFATSMKMEDVRNGHKSQMTFSKLETNKGIKDKVFTERNLRKWTR